MTVNMANIDLPFTRHYKDGNRVVWYYVRKGQGKIRLNPKGVEIGSPEFFERYRKAHEGHIKPVQLRKAPKAGTLAHLIESYLRSPEFADLAQSTQNTRRRMFARLQDEHGALPALIPTQTIRQARNTRAQTPAAANEFVKYLRALYSWGIEADLVDSNPAAGIKKLAEGDGHKLWPDEQLALWRTRWEVGTVPRLALEMLYWTAQRIGDIAGMGPANLAGDTLRFRQQKTKTDMVIPITPQLAEAMRYCPPRGDTFLGYGSAASLSNAFRRWRKASGVSTDYVAHGLRVTRLTHLANDGATAHEIMAWSGHQSLAEAQRYTRQADQERLARKSMQEQSVPRLRPASN